MEVFSLGISVPRSDSLMTVTSLRLCAMDAFTTLLEQTPTAASVEADEPNRGSFCTC
jgi:hypothetical protein